MYLPIIGSIIEAIGTILEKKILRKHKIDYKNYIVYGFLAIVLVMLPLIGFLWKVKPEAYQLRNLLIFAFVIFTSIIANLLAFYSLKRKNVTELEPIRLMQPLFTVLLAFIFSFFFVSYSGERKYSVLALALIASISLVAAHVKKHHLILNKYLIAALFGSLFFAIELVTSKSILAYYSSFTFYFLRCLLIFLITWTIYKPKLAPIKTKTKLLILIVGVLWVVYRVILYYGYLTLGIVFTTILFILAPVLIFLFARIFLKEKLTLRNIISAIIIVACVVLAIILEN